MELLNRIEEIEKFIDKLIKDKANELYPSNVVSDLKIDEDYEDLRMLMELKDYIKLLKDICRDMNKILDKYKLGR